jgi:sialate O-acetylesterase
MDVVYSGPLYRSMVVVGDTARLHFDHAAGLTGEPTNFTIAGQDQVFHPAEARIDGATILVRSDAVVRPAAVRYCWGTADEGALFNGAGLPASSFRSDAWPPVSARK